MSSRSVPFSAVGLLLLGACTSPSSTPDAGLAPVDGGGSSSLPSSSRAPQSTSAAPASSAASAASTSVATSSATSSATSAAASATSGGGGPRHADYKALTGYSAPESTAPPVTNFATFKNFKDIYSPEMMVMQGRLQDDPDRPGLKMYLVDSRTPDAAQPSPSILVPKVRVYMPPGTHSVHVATFTFYDTTTQQAAAYRVGEPPVSTVDQHATQVAAAFPDSTQVLRQLEHGTEWVSSVGPGANAMPSPSAGGALQGTNQGGYHTVQGGWMYIHFLTAIGNRVMEISTRMSVDQATYEAWYQGALWDDDGNPL